MTIVAGVVGAVAGFLVGLLISEVILGAPGNSWGVDWAFWIDVVCTVLGVLVGVSLGRRVRGSHIRARPT